ncbi:CoA transferase [Actinopolymorpha rutila]|uniref:Crotonobetainyl-CoA:carnitine CoA-transferase CaiB-like acyl-CoA transferase n=1 Tax=Actinopolymorpha rutila TaxID=446787 RepID=A0A852ZHG2_9ACTN|nr:CoA transferase [Actinopolymorpha rutila]NYH92354.1 crotonobetainyl-CoA:carnitine CoA-transferase CaiB-like acyl-CoA transferase [Actinopolymorpha rutila]
MTGMDASSLGRGELGPLENLIDQLGLAARFTGDATIFGSDPVIRSPHRLAEASCTAHLLIGAAGVAIWEARGGSPTDISMDVLHGLHHLHPTHFVEQSGYSSNVGAEFVQVNGVFATNDGGYVMLEAGPPYQKLLNGYLNFFDCGNNKDSFAREVAKWNAEDLEEALTYAGLPAARAFTREEWRAHPQGRALAAVPPIEIVKIADGDPVPFRGQGRSPLDGVRVLDFTHVLAGPRSARTLAEYGAEVLHISSPWFADNLAQHLGVDAGKYDAFLDLRYEKDMGTMRRLAATADVFASTYRPAVNERFGLLPEALAETSERGIVYMSADAYGHSGPWKDRPGFDQNGQVASGFALEEGRGGPPKFSPVFYVADLITGYLAAAGMMAALLRRAVEGGSYQVKLSLTRSVMWVQDLGLLDVAAQGDIPESDSYPAETVDIDTAYGAVTLLAPPLTFTNLTLPTTDRLVPYGSDPASWQSMAA